MPSAARRVIRPFGSRHELLEYAIQNVRLPDGLWLEFGVYKGDSINFIARLTQSTVYGFDSFAGLPEFWRDGYEPGKFSLDEPPPVEDNVVLIEGMFAESIPCFLDRVQGVIGFAHVDCDLYSSTKTVLDTCRDRFVAGSILVFDEFFNYPGWQEHEYKAFTEFITESKKRFEYIGYVETGVSPVALKFLTGGSNYAAEKKCSPFRVARHSGRR